MWTVWLSEVSYKDIDLVGGKNCSLGEMIQNLTHKGIKIPNGFCITTKAYDEFLTRNGLDKRVEELINNMPNDVVGQRRVGLKIRTEISNANIPEDMSEEILENYYKLSQQYIDSNGDKQCATDVAVRSSATAEDLPDASFAGQQETYLNVRGSLHILDSIKNCFASLFTDRAISYRKRFSFPINKIKMSVTVQKMVRSDIASAGVAFSVDTESGFSDVVLINGSFGLGEIVVSGAIKPDEFIVFKPTLKTGHLPILDKKMGDKADKIIYGTNPDEKVKKITTTKKEKISFSLSDNQIIQLANWVILIQDYYTQLKSRHVDIDVEWATDGIDNELYIVQAREETTVAARKKNKNLIEYTLLKNNDTIELINGIAVGDGVGIGKVKVMYSLDRRDGGTGIEDFKKGDILVTDMTDPDWEPLMKIAGGIITNRGGRTCHAAIIARELGVPAVVGTKNATSILDDGCDVTVSCAEGENGFVYSGIIEYIKQETDITKLVMTKTQIMLNVGNPDIAFQLADYPNCGVGLARLEFIINNFIKAHPCALLNDSMLSSEVKNKIKDLIIGYPNGQDYYINKLACGIAKIAAAFYPKDVIVRFSDFKSNEYEKLLGGEFFEEKEDNPMIGYRGCSRYYSDGFKEAFKLECEAIKLVRNSMGLTNVIVMLPFCRTLDECSKVLSLMRDYGVERGVNKLKVFLMCEIPSNVILADEFHKMVDGISFGTNDLTSLILGLDRDGEKVQHIFDERNMAVKKMISWAIASAKKAGIQTCLCGQAPSDHTDFAEFLVNEGIDSFSITPDSVVKTLNAVSEIEKKFV